MPTARINGVETYYEVEGEGTPVLYIHGGFGGAESTLFPLPSAFNGVLPGDRFRVITYDRRNAGRSAYSNNNLRIQDLANDAHALLEHLGIETSLVVGDSLGGQIAIEYASTWPQRVISLVLAETGAHIVRSTPKARLAIAALKLVPPALLIKLGRRRALNPPFYRPLGPKTASLVPRARARHEEYKRELRRISEADLTRYTMGILRNYVAFIGLDLSQRLDKLAMPVDILHGSADRVVPVNSGFELHRHIPHSRLHLIEAIGHGIFYYPEARQLIEEVIDVQAAIEVRGS